jgi:hypothetical protein
LIFKQTKRSKQTESSICLYYHSWLIFLSALSQYYRNQWRCREIAMSLLKTRTSVWQRNDMDQAQQMRFSVCVSVSIFRPLTKERFSQLCKKHCFPCVKDSPLPAWRRQGGTEWNSRSRGMYWSVHYICM